MMLSKIAIGYLVALTTAPIVSSASTNNHRRRLKVGAGESIGNAVNNEHAKGNFKGHYKIQAEDVGTAGGTLDFNVREAGPAVTAFTTTSGEGSNKKEKKVKMKDLDAILVADEDEEDMILMTVNAQTGAVQGITMGKKGKKISQDPGHLTFAYDPEPFDTPEWSCSQDHLHMSPEPAQITEGADYEEESRRAVRKLAHHHHHEHNHHDHDHHHDDHDHHDHEDIPSMLRGVRDGLRGSFGRKDAVQFGKRRKLQGSSTASYQVDLFIEVDQQLCDNVQDPCANGEPGPNLINYINAVITGANTVYESEIDTHLNVLHIKYTTAYSGFSVSGDALNHMVSTYGSSSWHYTNSQGYNPDLHHGLFGKGMGGGIAYVGVICNSGYGYGVSAGLTGNYVSMDQAVLWDMVVFMHELGHQFSTGHTHNGGYTPAIDTCGTDCSTAGLTAGTGQGTIMSYCHTCSGGIGNIKYTFGGEYDEVSAGDRGDFNSYINNADLTVNTEPRRINAQMYNHVSSASCAVGGGSPFQQCVPGDHAACDDGIACNGVEQCNSEGVCVPGAPLANCCGNDICEASDVSTCPAECLKSLTTQFCSGCYYGGGNIFTIEATQDLYINAFTVNLYLAGAGNVKIWERPGSYSGALYSSTYWDLHQDFAINPTNNYEKPKLTLTTPIFVAAGTTHSFYIYIGVNKILFTTGSGEGLVAAENGDMKIFDGRFSNDEFGGTGAGYTWNGKIDYEVIPSGETSEPTNPPTPNPTNPPTTATPTNNPTPQPTNPPTPNPTPVPSNPPTTATPTNPPSPVPTNPPTPVPTNGPTNPPTTGAPTNNPTPQPTNPPTPNPTPVPSNPPTPLPTGFPTNPPTPVPTNPPTPPPTPVPSNPPTPLPTSPPTEFSCSSITDKNTCNGRTGCAWAGKGVNECQSDGSSPPPPSPPSPPTPPPTSGGAPPTPPPTSGGGGGCGSSGASCSSSSECCSNDCRSKGKWAGTCS